MHTHPRRRRSGFERHDSRGIDKTQAQAIETLKLLLAKRADINRKDSRNGRTAMHGAAIWGWNDDIQFLADNGADPFIKDSRGTLPLDSALGNAGGFGRQGVTTARPETAELIRRIMAAKQGCQSSAGSASRLQRSARARGSRAFAVSI